jgi:uncharacterized protein (TIGR03086 family)
MTLNLTPSLPLEQLTRSLRDVGHLIARVRDDQWGAPTPCTEWTVRDLVDHLVAMNLVFEAQLSDQAPPERGLDRLGDDPFGAYQASSAAVRDAFAQPGVLERTYRGPLGAATGAERLQIRVYDLLAHGWDLAQATGQPVDLPENLAQQALDFVREQLSARPRAGRFSPPRPIADDTCAIDQLVAFLGRPVRAIH